RKLPQSATATKVRIWSRVRASSMICFSDQNYRNYVTSAVRPGSLAFACFALKRSSMSTLTQDAPLRAPAGATQWATVAMVVASGVVAAVQVGKAAIAVPMLQDRKSTRLNSSHVKISYAVFCLKKKNNNHSD